jgi:hypothetical protein
LSDECAVYKSLRERNVFFWSMYSPHYHEELENTPLYTIAEHIQPLSLDGQVANVTWRCYKNKLSVSGKSKYLGCLVPRSSVSCPVVDFM